MKKMRFLCFFVHYLCILLRALLVRIVLCEHYLCILVCVHYLCILFFYHTSDLH
jgi:hypothetical protein